VGPVQSASRSYFARITPENLQNEWFGFYALSGRATAFLGPLLVGWLTYWSGSQRIGMSIIIVFIVVGCLLMLTLTDEPSVTSPDDSGSSREAIEEGA
jgi:UMF1 family MFS transporter